MMSYQERVIEEKKALDYSLDKLRLFNSSEKARHLPREERLLLWRQEKIMVMYSDVLAERIERFSAHGVPGLPVFNDVSSFAGFNKPRRWCMCTQLRLVARDCFSTCAICGGQDAYGESPSRPENLRKEIVS